MSTFVSIIKLDSGVASYKVVERTQNDYTAYLVRNNSSQALPLEVNIDAQKVPHEGEARDPLVDKLLVAIRSNAFMEDDPA